MVDDVSSGGAKGYNLGESPEDFDETEGIKPGGPFSTDAPQGKPDEMTWGDYMLKPGRPLTPRHRRLAQLIAAGERTQDIAAALGLTEARVSVLRSNTQIKREAAKYQERIFEEDLQKRLKGMGHDALDVIAATLTDELSQIPNREKLDAAKWTLEKITGKATQVHDVGDNLLGLLHDKLDSLESAGKGLRDVIQIESRPVVGEEATPKLRTEEDDLTDFVANFSQTQSGAKIPS